MSDSVLDKITKGFIDQFMQAYEIGKLNEGKDFEKFSIYCAVKKDYSSHIENEKLDDIFVGDGDDTGIDGIGIIVENQLLEDIEEIDGIIAKKDNVQIVFIFVQSTVTKKFSAPKFRDFTLGVKEFFYDYAMPNKTKTKRRNKSIQAKASIASNLIEKTSTMIERPICKLYYLMGNEVESKLGINTDVVNSEKDLLLELNIFERVDIEIKGTKYLQDLYRNTFAKPKVQIHFPKKIDDLPKIDGVNASYMGVLSFSEFKKLIIDENGNIRNVFEDNVRYFSEKHPINKKIKETIDTGNIDKFVILNNGITIVTKKLNPSASNLTLEDYQIVNGCQTSHILYQCRNHPGIENLHVPVKIIHIENELIANEITIATNSQTPVNYEALNSLLQFHKELELYYSSSSYTVDKEQINLYYGRQEGKYEKDKNIKKSRIISVMEQAKCFAAMFLDVPHESWGFKGRIKKKIDDQIMFKEGYPFEPYYTSAVVHYELSKYLKNSRNEQNQFYVYRFHIMMLFKYLVSESLTDLELTHNESEKNKKLKKCCEDLINSVENKKKFLATVKEAIIIIEESLKASQDQEGANKTAHFVHIIIDKAKERYI